MNTEDNYLMQPLVITPPPPCQNESNQYSCDHNEQVD